MTLDQSSRATGHAVSKIIHRTSNGIILEETEDYLKKKVKKEQYLSNTGWKAAL
jgi:hypothetical protein